MTVSTETENIAVLKRSYEWANKAMDGSGHPVTRAQVERFFAADAKMATNDKVKCTGIDAHVEHFTEIQKKTREVVFHPFETIVAQGDRVGVYFKIDVLYSDGRNAKIIVCGVFQLRDRKIVNFTEVAHF